ncbi:MAG: hypothetical protein JWQ81_1630 [Amycolatopsis sp.]|uniref:nSTAND1 domain-containing NTPase n=1 Tax=Amycolatopsis sp. TaxID=37632 RepID=UPI002618F090|nr:NACHT domain-containing protein [Amycolatopsis sp.]MCU1680891.1 hypothetical protein [Amycolatopsis sp.]
MVDREVGLPRAVFAERFATLYTEAGTPSLNRVSESVVRARRADERGQPVRVTPQRISDWRRGRNVPARFSALAAVLEVLVGQARKATPVPVIEGLYDVKQWRTWWEEALASPVGEIEDFPSEASPAGEVCPYPGLAAFTQEDVAWFFGRERSTNALIRRLRQAVETGGIVMLTGASGAGKSSLIRAGLMSAVAKRKLAGETEPAAVVVMTPGSEPLAELSRQVPELAELVARADPVQPGEVETALTRSHSRWLLIVDQFEEVFTLCTDPWQRQRFVELLAAACTLPDDGVGRPASVLIGVRADFYGQCLDYPELSQALQDRQLVLGPMTNPEIQEAVSGPAKAVGLRLEPGLTDLLLRDLGVADNASGNAQQGKYSSGALPLLSHALLATWQRRDSGELTIAGYLAAGGIHGAVAATAEQAWADLEESGRAVVRAMLLRLVRVDRDGQDTRRTMPRQALLDQLTDPAAGADALEVLATARLVTLDADDVQITHEALLHAWPRLRKWVDEDRSEILVRQRLEDDAEEWQAQGREAYLLYRGGRLGAAEQGVNSAGSYATTGLASEFLRKSVHYRRRSSWIRRGGIALVAVFALIATTTAVIASNERDDAVFRQVVAEADRLQDTAPSLSAQIDLVAHQLRPNDQSVYDRLIPTQNTPLATPLIGHQGAVYLTTFSPDGRTLATASYDHTVRLWDVQDRAHPKPLGLPLLGHTSWVSSAVFSPDGNLLATAGDDQSIRLWDVADPAHPFLLGQPHSSGSGTIYLITFSPDGRTIAAANEDHTVRLWNVSDPEQTTQLGQPLTGHTARVRSVAFSPDGRTLAAGGDDSSILMWNVANPAEAVRIGSPLVASTGVVHTVEFSPNSRTLASGGYDDNTIRLWDVTDPRQAAPLGVPLVGHTASVWSVAFSPNGQMLASTGSDNTARLWNTADPTHVTQLGQPLTDTVPLSYAVGFSPDGRSLASGSNDGTVLLWSLPPQVLTGHTAAVTASVISPDGRLLVTTSRDKTARLWNVSDPAHPTPVGPPLTGDTGTIGAAAFGANGRLLATAGSDHDQTVRLWNLTNPAAPKPWGQALNLNTRYAAPLAISPDGRTLVTGVDDQTLQLWDISNPAHPVSVGRQLTGHTGYVVDVEFSPDGRTLATASSDQTVRLWNVADPRNPSAIGQPLGGYNKGARSLAFSPDGHTLAAGSDDASIRLWNVQDPANPAPIGAPLLGHTKAVLAVAFSPDGHTLVSSSADTTVRLWNLADSSSQEFVGQAVSGPNTGITLSPDGKFLAAAGDDNAVRIWSLDATHAQQRICSDTSGVLTPEQWQQHLPQLDYKPPCG